MRLLARTITGAGFYHFRDLTKMVLFYFPDGKLNNRFAYVTFRPKT